MKAFFEFVLFILFLLVSIFVIASIGVFLEENGSWMGALYNDHEYRVIGIMVVTFICSVIFVPMALALRKEGKNHKNQKIKIDKNLKRTPAGARLKTIFGGVNITPMYFVIFGLPALVLSANAVRREGIGMLYILLGIGLLGVLLIFVYLLALPEYLWRAYAKAVITGENGAPYVIPYYLKKQLTYMTFIFVYFLLIFAVFLIPAR